ncbi:MAG: YHS domain-containing protein [Bacteroidota bacterium]
MAKNIFGVGLLSLLLLQACNQSSNQTQAPENKPVPTEMGASEKVLAIDTHTLAIEQDVVCGMPVKHGVADTASYKGKLYGFCSEECKHTFTEAPTEYLTSTSH